MQLFTIHLLLIIVLATAQFNCSVDTPPPGEPDLRKIQSLQNNTAPVASPDPVPANAPPPPPQSDRDTSLLTSSIMVIVSEIGDKTFLVAAILAMTHPRTIVFAGAWSALAVMSVLSAILGTIVPSLISRSLTQALAGMLFFVFGIHMVKESRVMDPNLCEEELNKVQAEIRHHDDDLELGHINHFRRRPVTASGTFMWKSALVKIRNVFVVLIKNALTPIFVETFVLTFLAEWGDRSQIATIAMAATGNVMSVIFGTILGHSLCTGLAVLGGKLLASRISIRTMTLIGGIVFLIFALLTFVQLQWQRNLE